MNNDNEPEIDVPEENETSGLPITLAKGSLELTQPTQQTVTASQAKIQAIADLTHSAYQKAATLQLTKEESEALQADFPDEAFKTGAAGKDNLIYIEHAFLRDRFAQVFGMGQWAIITRRSWSEQFVIPAWGQKPAVNGERVYVEAMLVIRGCFVGEAIGAMEYYPKNNAQNYGDAVEGAKTAAFRRCAKEFGVGLQAWKKDWCQGWFDRKLGKKPVATPPPPAAPAKPKVEPKLPTAETRKWMIARLESLRKAAEEYFQKCGQLLPTETLEDLPLRFVPSSTKELDSLGQCIDNFAAGGDAVAAFEPHGAADVLKQKAVEVPRDQAKPEPSEDAGQEPWYGVIVPIPHKGQKRDDYLKNPDTIGSLYDARHDDEDARKRLWGFVEHFEPKGWTNRDGTEMPPSKADHEFRAALDQFSDWFEATHPDERL